MAPEFQSMGLLRVRGCCLFTWRQREYGSGDRVIDVGPHHCVACLHELRSLQPPVTLNKTGELAAARREPTRMGRVLVIEDEEPIRSALAECLEDAGCEVITAANGREALALLRSGAPLPNLIFLDLIMPEMDGYQFREEQKQDPRLAHLPVVVVSAVGNSPAVDARRVLRKPVGLDTLLETLQLRDQTPGSRPGRVMVVDDDAAFCEELQATLEDAGWDVVAVTNGREALSHLRSGGPLPNLIFLDLAMPEMDGYRFREAQAREPALAKIPVVVVTGIGSPRAVDAKLILRKPVALTALLQVLDSVPRLTTAP